MPGMSRNSSWGDLNCVLAANSNPLSYKSNARPKHKSAKDSLLPLEVIFEQSSFLASGKPSQTNHSAASNSKPKLESVVCQSRTVEKELSVLSTIVQDLRLVARVGNKEWYSTIIELDFFDYYMLSLLREIVDIRKDVTKLPTARTVHDL
eukprot:scaffold6572_cov106-Cylindrotheca_fusiformis.AAC.9